MATTKELKSLAIANQPTDIAQMDRIATCYLGGPMTGYEMFNFPAFISAAERLREAGWFVYSPAENDLERGEEARGDGVPQYPLKHYMAVDLAQVCKSDAVFLLPGWEHSRGALLEHQVAQYLEIPCYRFEDGGRITILETQGDEHLLGIDHDQIEQAEEATYKLLGEEGWGQAQVFPGAKYAGYPSAQEQIERAKSQAIIERRLQEEFINALNAPKAERHPNSARFHEILKGLGDLHDRKQRDYGAGDDPFANVRNSSGFGVDPWVGAMIRLNDKIKRLQSLIENGRLENESSYDSFKDIAVYAVIALVLFEEQYGREE